MKCNLYDHVRKYCWKRKIEKTLLLIENNKRNHVIHVQILPGAAKRSEVWQKGLWHFSSYGDNMNMSQKGKPHNEDLLSKLSLQICIHTLRLNYFNCHLLTTVCPLVTKSIKNSLLAAHAYTRTCVQLSITCTSEQKKKKKIKKRINTYRSPYDPDATLFSNFRSLGSTSQTSVPSLGIITWSGSNMTPIWPYSLLENDVSSLGQDRFCLYKNYSAKLGQSQGVKGSLRSKTD